jgi:dihydroorotase
VTLIDPEVRWKISTANFRSRSRNNPFDGRAVQGRIKSVLVDGQLHFPEQLADEETR